MVFLFAITLFIGAAMLFVAELMFAKMILPLLGGTPAVWNTCMVFFQAALLAGYGYAHMVTSRLMVKKQVWVHLVLIMLPLFFLPICIPHGWRPPTEANPVSSILLLMLASIGLPFAVVSTSAPLIQRWFAYTGHRAGRDPYFLYAASNAGSFVGLAGYIILLEPRLTIGEQSYLWRDAYIVLLLLTAVCAISTLRKRTTASKSPVNNREPAADSDTDSDAPVTLGRMIRWLLLAFAPSSLLLGFTSFITTDITSVPLLWVVPLSLYLLTFIIAFSRRRFIPQKALVFSLPVFVLVQTVILSNLSVVPVTISVIANILTFFIAAMTCHGELAADRPVTAHLTRFYLLISAGGALGGLFNGLVAPVIFSSVVEYPLVMVIACVLCLYHRGRSNRIRSVNRHISLADIPFISGAAGIAVCACMTITHFHLYEFPSKLAQALPLCLIAAACYALVSRPIRFGLGMGLVMLVLAHGLNANDGTVCQKRSFFGVLRVRANTYMLDGRNLEVHSFVHGTTLHGLQIVDPGYRRIPISYYYRTGPIGQLLTSYNSLGRLHDIVVTGLGAGSLAAYAQPRQNMTFYEIDPLVKEIAQDPRYFTFLADARARGANIKIVLGDARLTVAKSPKKAYDLIILDAFSSDSIPIHLLTKQAIAMFITKLRDHGVIAMQITNRFMDLEPIIGNAASSLGLCALIRKDVSISNDEWARGKFPSWWIIVSRDIADFGPLGHDPRWKRIHPNRSKSIWTDDYSNILDAITW